MTAMTGSGLVLGAGGIIGPAYHLSVLRALRDQTGRDPQDHEVFVGTSGGAIVAALLADGHSIDSLAEAFDIDGVGDRQHHTPLHLAVRTLMTLPHLSWGDFRLPPRAPRKLYPDIRQRIAIRTSSLFTHGEVDPLAYAGPFDDVFQGRWPDRLRLCAVHCATGERRVFGPNDGISVVTATAASCAVPGMFRPVEIDGEHYSDGGFFSPTNADVVLDHDLAKVTIVSPMSSKLLSRPASVEHPLRLGLHAIIARERRQLRRQGVRVTLVEANYPARRVIGADYMDPTKAPAVARAMTQVTIDRNRTPRLRFIA
jgi:NTE family protein